MSTVDVGARVERLAPGDELAQRLAGVRMLIDRPPVALADDAGPVVRRPGLEPDRAGLAAEQGVGLGRGHQAAADGEHRRLVRLASSFGQRLAFEPAVEVLAVQREDLAERRPARCSICWSSSTKGTRRRRASRRPTSSCPRRAGRAAR